MPQLLEMKIFVQLIILVDKMKVIVIHMMSAKEVWYVDLLTVKPPLVLTLKLIVAIQIQMLATQENTQCTKEKKT